MGLFNVSFLVFVCAVVSGIPAPERLEKAELRDLGETLNLLQKDVSGIYKLMKSNVLICELMNYSSSARVLTDVSIIQLKMSRNVLSMHIYWGLIYNYSH